MEVALIKDKLDCGYAKRLSMLRRLLSDGSDARPARNRAGFIDLRWVPRIFFLNTL
jgi:hypothetical protein